MKTMIKWSLLLLLCVLPLQLWAETHYDAGYGSVKTTTDIEGVRFEISRLRLYNYQGDNSHFSSNGKISVYVGDKVHVFHFSDLSRNVEEDKNFYYDGEGDEDQFKRHNTFTIYLYEKTRNGIKVRASLQNQHNGQAISPNDAVGYTSGTSDKWCLVTFYIKVATHESVAINISATWRDHSDDVNDDHEPVDWNFYYYQSGAVGIDDVESLNDAEAEYYDLSGRRLNGPQPGTNIVKRGGKRSKVIIK